MKKIIVSKKAIREMIRESLDDTSEPKSPVNVNPEVGPEMNPDDETGIDVKRSKVKENKMNNKNLVEAIVRAKVRKIIRENLSILEARGETPDEYLTVDDDGMKLPAIAKKMGKSVAGVHRDLSKGMEKFEKASWLYAASPAEMAKFELAGKEFINGLEDKALRDWETDPVKDTGETLIKSEDVSMLLGQPEVSSAVDRFVDGWLLDPDNYDDPEDMISPEDLDELRSNPASVITLPSFVYVFLADYLRDNFEVLDSMRTFAESPEYQDVFKKLEKKYGKSDRSAVKRGVKDTLASLSASRPD